MVALITKREFEENLLSSAIVDYIVNEGYFHPTTDRWIQVLELCISFGIIDSEQLEAIYPQMFRHQIPTEEEIRFALEVVRPRVDPKKFEENYNASKMAAKKPLEKLESEETQES